MSGSADSPATDKLREGRYIATAWPSIARFALARLLGRGYAVDEPRWLFVAPGNLLALATIPVGAALYFLKLAPFVCRRYVLTDSDVVVANGITQRPGRSVSHDAYDSIDVEVLPGQAWYDSGDLVFRSAGDEVLRLAAVAGPETFRRTVWEARQSRFLLRALLDDPQDASAAA